MTGFGGLTEEHQDKRGYGPLLLVAILVLALASSALVVLSNDSRFLRLSVLIALWATLIGALLAVRYRRESAAREEEALELQTVYELELEREITARREHELRIETAIRDRLAADHKKELDALRVELRALRDSLKTLLGGELLVERVALHAESTRMRSLPDTPLSVAARESLPAQSVDKAKQPIEAVELTIPIQLGAVDVPSRGREQRNQQRRPMPSRPEQRQLRQPAAQPATRQAPAAETGVPERAHQPARSVPSSVPPVMPWQETMVDVYQGSRPMTDDAASADIEGAHAAGTSVTELLAAYGGSSATQRRRRRAAD